jgi:hypothetical protein
MSRSKHTDPRSIRASRRIRAPFESRSAGDLSLRRTLGRMLKELDGVEIPDGSKGDQSVTRLRILWRQPSPGFHHPIGKQEVLELLKSIGPLAMYGLRSIELVRAPALGSTSLLVFGRYEAPGRILLFEQPLSPWRLPGSLASKSVRRLERAGAVVSLIATDGRFWHRCG